MQKAGVKMSRLVVTILTLVIKDTTSNFRLVLYPYRTGKIPEFGPKSILNCILYWTLDSGKIQTPLSAWLHWSRVENKYLQGFELIFLSVFYSYWTSIDLIFYMQFSTTLQLFLFILLSFSAKLIDDLNSVYSIFQFAKNFYTIKTTTISC